ncbi:MAG: hypothetical protein K0S55_390 [Clostridia bacterium]|nr:hypothetical protein [Clostridia bacterium]
MKTILSQGGYSDNAVHLTISGENLSLNYNDIIKNNEVGIYKQQANYYYDIYLVVFSKKYNFLHKNDFKMSLLGSNEQVAYIGNSVEKIKDADCNLIFKYSNNDNVNDFKVAGSLGYKNIKGLDNTVFINLLSLRNLSPSGYYIVDGNSKNAVMKAVEDIKTQVGGGGSIEILDLKNTGISNFLKTNETLLQMFFIFLIMICVTNIIFAILWLEKHNKDVIIGLFLGFKKIWIISDILQTYIKTINIAFFIGILIYIPILMFLLGSVSINYLLFIIIISMIILNLFSISALLFPMKSFFKVKDLNNLLK